MVPSMASELLGSDCMGAALQPLLLMIEEATNDDYAKHLQPVVKQVILIVIKINQFLN